MVSFLPRETTCSEFCQENREWAEKECEIGSVMVVGQESNFIDKQCEWVLFLPLIGAYAYAVRVDVKIMDF